jgi:endonuclease IV
MGQRPKDPNEAFAKRAKEVIDQALEQQGVVTQELLAKSGENIGPGYETYAETLDKIGGASGTTFPRYVVRSKERVW